MRLPFASHNGHMRVMLVPQEMDLANLASVQSLPQGLAEHKLEEIRSGWSIVQEQSSFPTPRLWQDLNYLLLFAVASCSVIGIGNQCYSSSSISNEQQGGLQASTLLAVGSAATAGSLAAALFFTLLARNAPNCFVWVAFSSPCFLVTVTGLCFVLNAAGQGGAESLVTGIGLAAFGIYQLVVTCRRNAKVVLLTVKLTKIVSDVIKIRPCVYSAMATGSFLGLLWTTICVLALERPLMEVCDVSNCMLVSCGIILFVWGTFIIRNVCHVTYCGIFGLWYCGKDCPLAMMSSLRVAATTSFGSVCFVSLPMLILQALAVMVKRLQQVGQPGKCLGSLLAHMLGCATSGIGDLPDYCNSWALVQCAVRGTSFLESAWATHSLIACANVQCIIDDLLLTSLTSFSSIVCCLVGGLVAAATGWALGGTSMALVGVAIGILIGMIVGAATLGVVTSGIMTLVVCWAEDPFPLVESHHDIHLMLESQIIRRLADPTLPQPS